MSTQLDQLTELITTSDDDLILIREGSTGIDKRMRSQNIRAKATTKADVALGNVDNTSDVNKPVSTAQQAALDAKAPTGSPTFTGTVTITDLAGNTTVTGTIDGRDISVDGAKLDGIAAGAQANVATNIAQGTRTATTVPVTSSTGTNATLLAATTTLAGVMLAADKTKLDGIEAGATDDQTAAEIKTAYESNANTNAFTDAEQSKLDGIEALADVTDTANVTAAGALMESTVDLDIKTLSLPANTTISAYGRTLIDDANAEVARGTLGLGTAAVATVTTTDTDTTAGRLLKVGDFGVGGNFPMDRGDTVYVANHVFPTTLGGLNDNHYIILGTYNGAQPQDRWVVSGTIHGNRTGALTTSYSIDIIAGSGPSLFWGSTVSRASDNSQAANLIMSDVKFVRITVSGVEYYALKILATSRNFRVGSFSGVVSKAACLDVMDLVEAANVTAETAVSVTPPATLLDGHQIFARNNILGTVSQTAGVPTGAVIERGSNANGEFVKFADGTMICTLLTGYTDGIATAFFGGFRSTAQTWTYPSAFSSNPFFSGSPRLISAFGVVPNQAAATFATFVFTAVTSQSSATREVLLFAKGRWF